MLWWPLIELLFSLRRAILRITPGGSPLCSKAYQQSIHCFHHYFPFTFYSEEDAVHSESAHSNSYFLYSLSLSIQISSFFIKFYFLFIYLLSLFTFTFYLNCFFLYSLSLSIQISSFFIKFHF